MWLKGTDQFLPSSPVDYQEFLPLTNFLLDDLETSEHFGEMEANLTDKCFEEADEFYTDLMDCTTMKHQDQLYVDVVNLSNDVQEIGTDDKEVFLEDKSNKNSACLDDSPQSVDIRDQLSHSDDALTLSSVSKAFMSAMLDSSKNETFCDLKTFLEKGCTAFSSVAANASKEDSILDNSSSSVVISSGDGEICFSTAFCHSEVAVTDLKESSVESDEFSEPSEKVRKLNRCCNSNCRDAKYAEMRQKNNVASQRSRQTKKQKEKEMEEKAVALEKENESLRRKEVKLQELVNKLKEKLFNSVNLKK